MTKNKIAVLFGGKSREHDVSINTGIEIFRSIRRNGRQVIPVYITHSGQWFIPDAALKRQRAFSIRSWITNKLKSGKEISADYLRENRMMAFLALHGENVEDGRLQGMLDLYGISYTGSGVMASALAFNKVYAKRIFHLHGIPTPDDVVIERSQFTRESPRMIARQVGLPCVLKIPESGSSYGMGFARSVKEIDKLLRTLFRETEQVMGEKMIRGKEISCGVLERQGRAVALPPTLIQPKYADYFDYRAKYEPGACEEITPAPLSSKVIGRIKEISLKAHSALGCRSYSRTDFMLARGKVHTLELNTLPGMTNTSLLPQQAKAYGISFSALIDHIIKNAQSAAK